MFSDAFVFWCGWILFAVILFRAGPALVLIPRRRLGRPGAFEDEGTELPRVSVIIAARDEEERIEATLLGLLASDYPNLQVILANDRSTDRTRAIAETIAAADSRLTVLSIDSVPRDWLGKTNALSRAASIADGEFLLFTDGDVQFEPDAVRLAVQHVLRNNIDHFCLFPEMETRSLPEETLVAFFAMLFSFGTQPWLRTLRLPSAYYGIGAFNLVRRSVYETVGGHTPIRLDILDDVKLGKLLFRHRARADYQLAGSRVRVRWQNSAWGVICGLEKNAFASMDYSVIKLIGFSLFYIAVFLSPWIVLPFFDLNATSGFAASLGLLHIALAGLAKSFGARFRVALLLLFASSGMLFAFWRSALITLRRGGVNWRDTFYPLTELRAGLYR